jgi:hypothetical protein
MTEPHARFEAWLAESTPGDPPRDLALHASTCAECLARAAGLDALRAVDPGLAPMPPLRVGAAPRATGMTPVARAVAGVAAAGLLGTAVLVGAAVLTGDPSPAGDRSVTATRPPGGGVLGEAGGGPEDEPTARSTASPSSSAGDDETPEATPIPDAFEPVIPQPPPPAPAGTQRPVTPSPAPTRAPTPRPTPTPSPSPSPTPSPTLPPPSLPAPSMPDASPTP